MQSNILPQAFQFPYCVGKFNLFCNLHTTLHLFISIPVLRGEVQRAGRVKLYNKALISIPVLRGEVQLVFQCLITPFRKISIPVLRGEVQQLHCITDAMGCQISIPVLRGEVQLHPYVMPDSSIFQNTFSRIDYNPIMHSVHFLYKISKTLILCLVRVSHTFHVCL